MKRLYRHTIIVALCRLLVVCVLAVGGGQAATQGIEDACYCWERDRSGYDEDLDVCVICTEFMPDVCGCGSECVLGNPMDPFYRKCMIPVQ